MYGSGKNEANLIEFLMYHSFNWDKLYGSSGSGGNAEANDASVDRISVGARVAVIGYDPDKLGDRPYLGTE